MLFSYQSLVLAALAFEAAFAQPAHRHMHQHQARSLSDVLGKRDSVDWSSPSTYKNPVTGKPFTKAEWACFVAKDGDSSCNTIDGGAPPASSSSPAPVASAPEEKVAEPASHASSAPDGSPSAITGTDSDSGPGVHVFNKGSSPQKFAFYKNDASDYGQATTPDEDKVFTLAAGADKFVPLPTSWKGHVQRGQSDLTISSAATWVEFQVDDGTGQSWGNISLEKGCDGAAYVISPESGTKFGFDWDIIGDAPDAAKVKTPDGQDALDYTMGGYRGTTLLNTGNPAAISWAQDKVGQKQAYILGGTGTGVVQSTTQILHAEFY